MRAGEADTPKVNPLASGPLVGHTTATGFRIWGRAPAGTPATGVARIREYGRPAFGQVRAFPFVEYYDCAGIVDFGRLFATDTAEPLRPGTRYDYEVGWVAVDSVAQATAHGDSLQWPESGSGDEGLRGSTRTFPAQEDLDARTIFLCGSCRDPMLLGDHGERTFGSIGARLSAAREPHVDFIVMTGDQIYIDHILSAADTPEGVSVGKYWEKYRKAWSMPRFAGAMRRTSAYMTMDDHEVQNNWTRGKFEAERSRAPGERKFLWATMMNGLRAYEAYQASLSPLVAAGQFGQGCFAEESGRVRYYYDFRHGQCDFFVLDVRSDSDVLGKPDERPTGNPAAILREEHQLRALKSWLVDGRGAVKFVVSAIPVFPDTQGWFGSPEDKWGGAREQRAALLDYVWANKARIPRLVFLSGDVHVSFVAELKHEDDPDYRVYNVVASAFNWVVPGLQNSNFAWGPLEEGNGRTPRYVSSRFSSQEIEGVHKANNYARVTADRQSVLVEFIRGRDNVQLERTELRFGAATPTQPGNDVTASS